MRAVAIYENELYEYKIYLKSSWHDGMILNMMIVSSILP